MVEMSPERSAKRQVMFRVAATVWRNCAGCGVRRCRRNRCCIGPLNRFGYPPCLCDMTNAAIDAMVDFLDNTAELAVLATFTAMLAQARTKEERKMIEFRRLAFLYYHQEMVKAGLSEPLGPPFVEG